MAQASVAGGLIAVLLLLQVGLAAATESTRYRTTDPDIALRNLDFQINRMRQDFERRPQDVRAAQRLLDHLLTRVQFLGTFSDYDEALRVTEDLLERRPGDPDALLARARILERLHEFDATAAILAELPAERADDAARVQARIALARGEPEAILADARRWAENGTFAGLSLLAFTLQGLGRTAEAEAVYLDALQHWDQVSPFAIAWVEFQRGELHVGRDDARAERHYRQAIGYLPAYVTARVHLSEVLADAGDLDGAIELLANAPSRSEDPEVASRHAEFLLAAGQPDAAAALREQAARGYEELLERHPLAFLDHAAEFWLGAGDDPQRAWELASANLDNGASGKALALALEAAAAAGRAERCDILRRALPRRGRLAELDEQLDEHAAGC